MRRICSLSLIFMMVLCVSCIAMRRGPAPTQLEVRQFQTRTFDTSDVKMIMKAMLHVLQDDGYMVKQANLDLGFLSATKEKDIENGWDSFWSEIMYRRRKARWRKTLITECTANVSEFGLKTKVRVTFQEKLLDNHGDVLKIRQINDAKFYQQFFSKLNKGIFIQREKI